MRSKITFKPVYPDSGLEEWYEIHALVNWDLLEPYWQKEPQIGQPDRSKLTGYLKQWFREGGFVPSCIHWNDHHGNIGFCNGRHRLALITKHQSEVPVVLPGQSILQPEIQRAVIRILQPDDEIELPDLGFVEGTGTIPVIRNGIITQY
ncbi:MAG: hypothetical protein JXR25_13775 [Pontiellaceae bacterium]|nr:hypothetical protein [Pontiellaceae bacterium]